MCIWFFYWKKCDVKAPWCLCFHFSHYWKKKVDGWSKVVPQMVYHVVYVNINPASVACFFFLWLKMYVCEWDFSNTFFKTEAWQLKKVSETEDKLCDWGSGLLSFSGYCDVIVLKIQAPCYLHQCLFGLRVFVSFVYPVSHPATSTNPCFPSSVFWVSAPGSSLGQTCLDDYDDDVKDQHLHSYPVPKAEPWHHVEDTHFSCFYLR